MQSRSSCLRAAVLICSIVPLVAVADVSFERSISVRASGPVASLSAETRVKTQVSSDRSRTEVIPSDDMAADLSVADVRLIRLDQEMGYILKHDMQSYSQFTLEALADELAGLRSQLNAEAGGQVLPVATENCEWSEARFKAKETKEKERIAGKRATRHIFTMSQSCTDEISGQSCDMQWIMEPWLANKLPGYEEVSGYYADFADYLGMDYLIPQMSGASQMLLALFPNRWESLLDELEAFKGYPMRTMMTMKIGGRACFNGEGEAAEEDNMWGNAADSASSAAVGATGSEANSAISDATSEAMGDSIGGSIGGSAIGAATGEIIGGLFSKKKKTATKKKKSANGPVTVFRIVTEITEWDDDPIPAQRYDIPMGWQLQE